METINKELEEERIIFEGEPNKKAFYRKSFLDKDLRNTLFFVVTTLAMILAFASIVLNPEDWHDASNGRAVFADANPDSFIAVLLLLGIPLIIFLVLIDKFIKIKRTNKKLSFSYHYKITDAAIYLPKQFASHALEDGEIMRIPLQAIKQITIKQTILQKKYNTADIAFTYTYRPIDYATTDESLEGYKKTEVFVDALRNTFPKVNIPQADMEEYYETEEITLDSVENFQEIFIYLTQGEVVNLNQRTNKDVPFKKLLPFCVSKKEKILADATPKKGEYYFDKLFARGRCGGLIGLTVAIVAFIIIAQGMDASTNIYEAIAEELFPIGFGLAGIAFYFHTILPDAFGFKEVRYIVTDEGVYISGGFIEKEIKRIDYSEIHAISTIEKSKIMKLLTPTGSIELELREEKGSHSKYPPTVELTGLENADDIRIIIRDAKRATIPSLFYQLDD